MPDIPLVAFWTNCTWPSASTRVANAPGSRRRACPARSPARAGSARRETGVDGDLTALLAVQEVQKRRGGVLLVGAWRGRRSWTPGPTWRPGGRRRGPAAGRSRRRRPSSSAASRRPSFRRRRTVPRRRRIVLPRLWSRCRWCPRGSTRRPPSPRRPARHPPRLGCPGWRGGVEHPVVDGVATEHRVEQHLDRERHLTALVAGHQRDDPGLLRRRQGLLEFVERGRRVGHPEVGGQVLVVVQARDGESARHRVLGTGATDPVPVDPVHRLLPGRQPVPPVGVGPGTEVGQLVVPYRAQAAR